MTTGCANCPFNPMLSVVMWGGATAFTISVVGMAILVLTAVWAISGRRVGLQKTT